MPRVLAGCGLKAVVVPWHVNRSCSLAVVLVEPGCWSECTLLSQELNLRLKWVESFEYSLLNNQGFVAVLTQEEQVYLSLPLPLVTPNS